MEGKEYFVMLSIKKSAHFIQIDNMSEDPLVWTAHNQRRLKFRGHFGVGH